MVSFTCDVCQDVVKKSKVDTHCDTRCRNAWVFTCVDCNKAFSGFEYRTHNSCITEEEKYWGPYAQHKKPQNVSAPTSRSPPSAPAASQATIPVASSVPLAVALPTQSAKAWKQDVDAYLKRKASRESSVHWNHLARSVAKRFATSQNVQWHTLTRAQRNELMDCCLASIPLAYCNTRSPLVRLPGSCQ